MKPNQTINKGKLNLNKQTIQKLDSNKLDNVNAGLAAAGPISVGLSISTIVVTEVFCTVICLTTQA